MGEIRTCGSDERTRLESERRFQALADLLPCVIWTAEPHGRVNWANQRWLDYSCMSLDALQSAPTASIHPNDCPALLAQFQRARTEVTVMRTELRLRRHDGEYRWHLVQQQPILDEGGALAYWLGSATDVHVERGARQEAEKMRDHLARARNHAEKERQRLARVLEQAPFAVAVTTGPQHILQSANARQLRQFGARATLNLSLRDAFPEKELEPVHAIFDRAFFERETVVLREQYIGWDRTGSGDVEYGYFDLIYQPVTDELGTVEGLLCVSIDVSQSVNARLSVSKARDEAEAARGAAEDARERLDNILAAIPTAIAVTSGPSHVYELVNGTYERMSGRSDLRGQPVSSVYPQVQQSGFTTLLDRVYRTGVQEQSPERRIAFDKYQDGSTYEGFFSSFFAPLRTRDGAITGVVASAIEVTEQVQQRRRIEELRLAAEKARSELEEAHVALECRIEERTRELARTNEALQAEIGVRRQAEAAHSELQRRLNSAREDEQRRTARDLHDQIGQSLSALMLSIKTACEAEPLSPATKTRLQEALQLAEALGRDVHDIATRLRPAVLDAFGLHAALRQLTSDWSQRCGIGVDLEAAWLKDKRFPAEIETTLYRVTQEALTNVAKHARASHVSVVVERRENELFAIVEDNGVGFDPAALAPGRMGLMSMRERVTLANGTLDLESEPGRGTTVLVTIPVSEQSYG